MGLAGHRRDQLTVAGVAGQFTEERAAEALFAHVGHLALDGRRGVVAPPLVTAEGVRGAGDRARGRTAVLDHLVVLDAGLVRARRGAGGRPTRLGLRHTGPPATVEPDAEQQLRAGNALALE